MDEPLIYTSKGNLPIASLDYSYGWDDTENALVFWEQYKLGDEIVKRGAHVYTKHGVIGQSIVNSVN